MWTRKWAWGKERFCAGEVIRLGLGRMSDAVRSGRGEVAGRPDCSDRARGRSMRIYGEGVPVRVTGAAEPKAIPKPWAITSGRLPASADYWCILQPPPAYRSCPVSQCAWFEASNTITSAISSGMPQRRSGVLAEIGASCSGVR